MDNYKEGDTIFILMTAEQCKSAMTEWLEHNYECNLNVMRSQKNKGCFVIKTKSLGKQNHPVAWVCKSNLSNYLAYGRSD